MMYSLRNNYSTKLERKRKTVTFSLHRPCWADCPTYKQHRNRLISRRTIPCWGLMLFGQDGTISEHHRWMVEVWKCVQSTHTKHEVVTLRQTCLTCQLETGEEEMFIQSMKWCVTSKDRGCEGGEGREGKWWSDTGTLDVGMSVDELQHIVSTTLTYGYWK